MNKNNQALVKGSCSSYKISEILKFLVPFFNWCDVIYASCFSGWWYYDSDCDVIKLGSSTLCRCFTYSSFIFSDDYSIETIVTKLFTPKFILKNEFLNNLFNVTPVWFVIRILAAIFIVMAVYEIGFEAIFSLNTGGLVLVRFLLPILFSVFLFAGLFLPLLLNFGLLEFVGTLLSKVMRPVFNLPGRSAIDCIASWLGDGTIGVLLTSKQYEDGFYTKREEAVIGTTFSLVSITFSLVVIKYG